MTVNEYILNISNDSKIVKEIARMVKNSTGSPDEIMAKIANHYRLELPKNLNLEIHIATDDVFYFVIPIENSDSTAGIEESIVAAGGAEVKLYTAGTLSCASTYSCASCVTSFFSLSTAGSAFCLATFGGYEGKKKPNVNNDWE